MFEDQEIDVERLREDLENESLGAFWGGGFGGALVEAGDIRRASDDEILKIALRKGVNLEKYIV